MHAQNQPGATIENKNEKTIDDGCSEQTFTKTCLKKFPRLKVKADVQKTIHEALFGLEGNKEGSKWLPTVKDSARFPEIPLIRSMRVSIGEAGAQSRESTSHRNNSYSQRAASRAAPSSGTCPACRGHPQARRCNRPAPS